MAIVERNTEVERLNPISNMSNDDMELLRKIFEFGGYTTAISLSSYIKDELTYRALQIKLDNLANAKYLRKLKLYCDSDRYPTVYQVTKKSCSLFDNPDSYFRKKHQPIYILRALIKQQFLFEICGSFEETIISLHENRLDLLINEIGFKESILPKKTNSGTSMLHVEEYILDLRNCNKILACPANNKVLFDGGRLVIVYVDKQQSNFGAQLKNLIYNKYAEIIKTELVRVDFLIVVDSEKRELGYKKAIEKEGLNKKVFEIPDRIMQYHYSILADKLNVTGTGSYEEFKAIVGDKYSSVQDINPEEYKEMPVNEIKTLGIRAIEKLSNAILNSDISHIDKVEKIFALFKKIYKLYAVGTFDSTSKFEVKVYRTEYSFSQK